MNSDVIIGLLLGGLVSSLIVNAGLWFSRMSFTRIWRERAREAEDAKKASDLRCERQIDAMLERLHTSDRLELNGASQTATVDPAARRYIPDTEDADRAWDEYRGVERDDDDGEK